MYIAAARAQACLAYLLFCVGIWVGSPRYIPEKPICIHSLSTCTFPVLVIIYLKHYLYSCICTSLRCNMIGQILETSMMYIRL